MSSVQTKTLQLHTELSASTLQSGVGLVGAVLPCVSECFRCADTVVVCDSVSDCVSVVCDIGVNRTGIYFLG